MPHMVAFDLGGLSLLEVVGAEIGVGTPVAQHVVEDDQDTMRDGNHRLLFPSAPRDAVKLGREVVILWGHSWKRLDGPGSATLQQCRFCHQTRERPPSGFHPLREKKSADLLSADQGSDEWPFSHQARAADVSVAC